MRLKPNSIFSIGIAEAGLCKRGLGSAFGAEDEFGFESVQGEFEAGRI
jgi:hypothetical protein